MNNYYDDISIEFINEKFKKLWNNVYHGKQSSFEIFKQWCISREIHRASKKRCYDLAIPYRDHFSSFNDVHGQKIIVIQPYDSNFIEIQNWCFLNGFVAMKYQNSWYYPNKTKLYEIYNLKE